MTKKELFLMEYERSLKVELQNSLQKLSSTFSEVIKLGSLLNSFSIDKAGASLDVIQKKSWGRSKFFAISNKIFRGTCATVSIKATYKALNEWLIERPDADLSDANSHLWDDWNEEQRRSYIDKCSEKCILKNQKEHNPDKTRVLIRLRDIFHYVEAGMYELEELRKQDAEKYETEKYETEIERRKKEENIL